jgi:hypothetical protein
MEIYSTYRQTTKIEIDLLSLKHQMSLCLGRAFENFIIGATTISCSNQIHF